ncbi:unnamed protein product, partial [Brenthis ino]
MMMLKQRGDPKQDVKEKLPQDQDWDNDGNLSPYSIREQLTRMAKKVKNATVAIEVIGRTVEYNDIVLLKMTKNHGSSDKYFRAGNDKYEQNEEEKKIIFIVQGLSVMGAKSLGIWNKNVALQGECPGVALDRNFDISWNNNRSINSCNQEYPGPVPFSEAETRAVRDVFHRYNHKIAAYFHVHAGSYDPSIFKGDAVLYPKGYTDSALDDDKYIDLRAEIEEAMRNASFRVLSVTVDTLYNWYGKVGGSSVDYASTVYGIPFALELVMQLYESESREDHSWNALSEIWFRILQVIFEFIWKNNNGNEIR